MYHSRVFNLITIFERNNHQNGLIKTLRLLCVVGVITIFSGYSAVFCEVVQSQPCYSTPSNSCELVTISVNPCPEALEEDPCNLLRGTNVTWIFDFVPKFSGENISFRVYSHTPIIDIPFPGLDRNACNLTKCPFISGKKRTLKYTADVLRIYPAGYFMTKWIVSNEKNEECCWMVPIYLV